VSLNTAIIVPLVVAVGGECCSFGLLCARRMKLIGMGRMTTPVTRLAKMRAGRRRERPPSCYCCLRATFAGRCPSSNTAGCWSSRWRLSGVDVGALR